ncbi:MAG: phosphotransferase [Bacteroidota bacterium]
MQPWEAEIEMSPDIAKGIIEKEIGQFKVKSISPFAQGWDKTAYLVNNEFLFHFTRREIAIQTVKTEIKYLPLITQMLSVPVPKPEYHGEFANGFPFFAYRPVPGRMVVEAQLNEIQRLALAPKLGEILLELHSIPVTGELNANFPKDYMGKLNIEKRSGQIDKNWEVIDRLGLGVSAKFRDELIATVRQETVNSKSCVVHGDLYSRHLMIKNGAISGIIDWGDMHLNHPARDLSFAVNYLPPNAFSAFISAYGEINEQDLCLALFSAMNHTLYVADYAMDIGDELLRNECKWGLENIVKNYPY